MSDGREATLGEAQEFLRNSKERAIEAGEFEAAERLRRMEFAIRDGTGRMKAVERENLQLRQTPPNVAAESEAERLRKRLGEAEGLLRGFVVGSLHVPEMYDHVKNRVQPFLAALAPPVRGDTKHE
jgi:hypothetical protein